MVRTESEQLRGLELIIREVGSLEDRHGGEGCLRNILLDPNQEMDWRQGDGRRSGGYGEGQREREREMPGGDMGFCGDQKQLNDLIKKQPD